MAGCNLGRKCFRVLSEQFRCSLGRISTRRKNVEPRKVEHIPTIRGSTFFRGDNSIGQSDCRKPFRLDIFPPSGDPALWSEARRSLHFALMEIGRYSGHRHLFGRHPFGCHDNVKRPLIIVYYSFG